MNAHSILGEAVNRRHDSGWLAHHVADVYDALVYELEQDGVPDAAAERLLLVYPYVLPHGDIKRWTKLLQDTLTNIEKKTGQARKAGSGSNLSLLYLLGGPSKPIETALNKALRRARQRLNPSVMLEAYINLFKSQVYRQTAEFNSNVIVAALDLARWVNDQDSYARLHQALAYAYNFWGNYDKAIDQAHLAFPHWEKKDDPYEAGLCAYAIAFALRSTGAFDSASEWLEKAGQLLARTEYHKQYALLAYETAGLLLYQLRYEEALQWIILGIEEAIKLGEPLTLAVLQQALAVAQTYTNRYDDAIENFARAEEFWITRGDNEAQLAHLYHARAFLEGRRGKRDVALDYLDKALALYSGLPRTHFHLETVSKINKLRTAIETNADLTQLTPLD